jgi:hypothetical protein
MYQIYIINNKIKNKQDKKIIHNHVNKTKISLKINSTYTHNFCVQNMFFMCIEVNKKNRNYTVKKTPPTIALIIKLNTTKINL